MFIDFRNEGNKIVLQLRLLICQLKSIQVLQVYILNAHVKREKFRHFHTSFSPASFQGEETGSSVPLCRTQTLSLFMLSGESKRPLPV